MAEQSAIQEAIASWGRAWRKRKGMEVYCAVFDTIEAIWGKDLKPLIRKKKKHEAYWNFVITLPAGLTYSDFKRKEMHFADATGGAVQIEKRGKAIIMQVMTEDLKPRYPFNWDFAEYEKMYLPVPFGYSATGFIVRDLADGPNLIIAGHPGAGKSNFIHVLVCSLLLARKINLMIIDLKKLEFSYLKNSGAMVITSMEMAQKVLAALNQELDNRLDLLEQAGVVKIQDYPGEMKFFVLVVDELAEMQDEVCQTMLNRVLRLGRAAGICVVAATQRPSSTMFQKFGDSKAMFAATMCFHVRDAVNSRMLLDNDRAAEIPNIPGRAIYQWDRELEVQTMFLPVKQARKLLAGVSGVSWIDEQSPKRLPPK